jgi:hypothetical protein
MLIYLIKVPTQLLCCNPIAIFDIWMPFARQRFGYRTVFIEFFFLILVGSLLLLGSALFLNTLDK